MYTEQKLGQYFYLCWQKNQLNYFHLKGNYTEIAYIHGRPSAHPMHAAFAKSVGAKFHYVDFKMRWQDQERSVLYRMLSWIVCAFIFPDKKKYKMFLVDNLHFMPVLMKMFGLLSKKQKIVAHMGSHTLYFMYVHRFSKINEWLHKQALKRYDALICEGEMAEDLVKKILGPSSPPTYVVINGIPSEHFPKNDETINVNESKNILFMGHGPGKERLWYKGLDIMIASFDIAYSKDPSLTFTIVGNWNQDLIQNLLAPYKEKTKKAIRFVSETINLKPFIKNSGLYIHCARGEAYGLTILIAMAYGLPPLISEWTGAKEVVNKVNLKLISPLDKHVIAEKINWYFNLSMSEKKILSDKSRQVALQYTEDSALEIHRRAFSQMLHNFEIGL